MPKASNLGTDEYSLLLVSTLGQRVATVKTIRSFTYMLLREAVDIINETDCGYAPLLMRGPLEAVNHFKQALEKVGAVVEIVPPTSTNKV